jgi:4-amino-4-deoxy-L-arabinose transferase-like glycosyltransferase
MARETKPTARRGLAPEIWLLLVMAAALPSLFWNLRAGGFSDNEAMYAALSRNMLTGGDWITPHLNGARYLNKPPLILWLIAGAFRLFGTNENARIVSGIPTLLTAPVLYALARELWPERRMAGVWAAAAFLTGMMTPVEARILRSDCLLTLCVTLSMWGAVRLERQERDALGGAALWGGIGLGLMAKGLLALALPAAALIPALVLARETRAWRRYVPWWGPLLALAIALPWYVAASVRNPGFAWDFVVNQHLLAFMNLKFPKDSVADSLPATYGALAGRLFPWLLLLPMASVAATRDARRARSTASWLPLAWFGVVVALFTLNTSRQIHYMLPAVPAAALIVGAFCEDLADLRAEGPVRLTAILAALTALTLAAWWAVGPALQASGIARQAPKLLPIAARGFLWLALGAGVGVLLALGRRPAVALGLLAAAAMLVAGNTARAMDACSPFTSARELIRRCHDQELGGVEIVYEAGQEYQLCGSYDFYLGEDVTLLTPPGSFVPPTYLAGDVACLFTPRERVWQEWRAGRRRILLFTDPDRPGDRPGDFPHACYEVGREANRRLLTNLPLPERTAMARSNPSR